MKKRVTVFLLLAAMLLTLSPGTAAGVYASEGMASGDKLTERLTTDMAGVKFETSFDMVFVEGGTFTLGWQSPDYSLQPADVAPVRNVTVSDFYIGETEVTEAMWNAVMGLSSPGNANRPKEFVNFYQVQEFLSRLYVLTGRTYRLATEAEWEFAAKGGKPGFDGNAEYPGNNHEYNFAGSNVHDEVVASKTAVADVKTKKPNILGIYDMSGNAEEWVYDTWNAAHTGGVDPIGPGGHIHQQKTRRGGTYGTMSDDSTRTAAARQIRSIDGGAGMGFRIALSGDMDSVPPGMIRPRDIEHPNIDERTMEVSYRDRRWVTNDDYIWSGSFAGTMSFTMKLWETGEMVIQSPGYPDRIGQWYSVSNLGIVFVENAGTNAEKRMTLPYVFMTETYVTVINDVSFTGDGAPIGRFEKVAETSSPIAKPEVGELIAPDKLAEASVYDHTSYDLSEITAEMRGQDPRLFDGEGYGWWQTGGGGIHQYRKDATESSFRFVVYSPAFGSGTGGADVGYGANHLANVQTWYTVNDMLLVLEGGNYVQHYLYTVTDEITSINVFGATTRQLMHISYMDYEKGDQRIFELHPNASVRGYTKDIPYSVAFSFGKSMFRAAPAAETVCPGGCGEVISACSCPTICPDCGSHISKCYCDNAAERLTAAARDCEAALNAYSAANSTTQAHLDAVARTAAGFHEIERTWTAFEKTNANPEGAGFIAAAVTLSLAGETATVNAEFTIEKLPAVEAGAGWTIVPESTLGGSPLTITATGIVEGWGSFDLGTLFGTPGAGPFAYGLWFEEGASVTFNMDVTLSYQGVSTKTAAAGETFYMDESWSEYAFTLDDGNSVILVFDPAPGNWAATLRTEQLDSFPGTVTPPSAETVASEETPPADTGADVTPAEPAGGAEAPQKGVNAGVIIAVILAVAVLGAAVYFLVVRPKKRPPDGGDDK